MMKDVLISINSVYAYDREEQDSLEFTTDGYYFYENDVGCLSYLESEVTGLDGTRTSVFVMPDRVVIDRDGKASTVIEANCGSSESQASEVLSYISTWSM